MARALARLAAAAAPLLCLAAACDAALDAAPCPTPGAAFLAASLEVPPPELRAEAASPVPLALNLPFPGGVRSTVSQAPDGGVTHLDAQRFAWDFAVPVGTPVTAAASGVVVLTADGSDAFGADPSFRDLANLVVVDHGAGLFTAYVHLDAGGVLVAAGERVEAGALLGLTGLSGQLTGPHLHFHVENVWSETLPARFVDVRGQGCDLFPALGEDLRAAPARATDDLAPSEVPPETFAAFGVTALTGLPARRFERGRPYAFSGRASAGTAEVAFLLLPDEGGSAVEAARFPVASDGAFAGTLTVGAPAGAYGWALTVAGAEPARVARSVRCAVTD
jgi:murein DD-endopeptidase MepM/ murein hydrolase activator NlpD